MSDAEGRPGPRAGTIVAIVVGALLLAFLLLAGLGIAGFRYWSPRTPAAPRGPWHELVLLEYDDGKVVYHVNGREVSTEAELTSELRKLRASRANWTRDGLVAEFVILPYIIRADQYDGLTREHYERAKAACHAAGAGVKGLEKPPSRRVTLQVSLHESGMGHYRDGRHIDAIGERELGRQIAELHKMYGEVVVDLDGLYLSFLGGVTEKHLEAVKAACEAAGAKVKRTDPGGRLESLQELAQSGIAVPEGRSIAVRAVGVRDGALFFRVGSGAQLAEGNAGLTEALRKAANDEEEKAGGVLPIAMTYSEAEELVLSEDQSKATRAAIFAAGPEIYFPVFGVYGYRKGDGRTRAATWLEIVGTCAGGNRYLLGNRPVEGEDALEAELAQMVAKLAAEQPEQERHVLRVTLCDNPKDGKAPTEDQLARACKTIAAGTAEPIKKVVVNVVGPSAEGNRYLLDGQPADGEAALKAALAKALADHRSGRKKPELYTLKVALKVEVKPGVTATEEQIALAHRTIEAAGVERSKESSAPKEPEKE